jgi:hypothetical protein
MVGSTSNMKRGRRRSRFVPTVKATTGRGGGVYEAANNGNGLGGAVILGLATSITIDNSGFSPLIPGSNQLVKSAQPSHSMISSGHAIRDARRYAGRQ